MSYKMRFFDCFSQIWVEKDLPEKRRAPKELPKFQQKHQWKIGDRAVLYDGTEVTLLRRAKEGEIFTSNKGERVRVILRPAVENWVCQIDHGKTITWKAGNIEQPEHPISVYTPHSLQPI